MRNTKNDSLKDHSIKDQALQLEGLLAQSFSLLSLFMFLWTSPSLSMAQSYGIDQGADPVVRSDRALKRDCRSLLGAIQHRVPLISAWTLGQQLDQSMIVNAGPDSWKYGDAGLEGPWAGYYYPMAKGGIATRVGSNSGYLNIRAKQATLLNQSRDGRWLSASEVVERYQSMTPAQRFKLSTTEKWDLYRGYFDFRTTQWELENRGPLRSLTPKMWEGFCNGMRAAGVCSAEPLASVTVRTHKGLDLEFSIADLKKLAAANYFYVEFYYDAGENTHPGAGVRGRDFRDPHPVMLHAYMTFNAIHPNQAVPMVLDVSNSIRGEIWNETYLGYRNRRPMQVRGLDESERRLFSEALGARQVVEVEREIFVLGEVSANYTNRITSHNVAELRDEGIKRLTIRYKLFIDENNKMVGGEWLSRPDIDFVWFPWGRGTDRDHGGNPYLSDRRIRELIDQSRENHRLGSQP